MLYNSRMIWQSLWARGDIKIRKRLLVDFIKLDDWFEKDFIMFQKLGTMHSALGNDSVLIKLSKMLDMSPDSLELLKSFTRASFSELRDFCSYFLESAKDVQDFKLVGCTTSKELGYEEREKLQLELEKMLQTEVVIRYRVKPEILGGSVLELDYVSFDNSHSRYFKSIEKRCSALLRGVN